MTGTRRPKLGVTSISLEKQFAIRAAGAVAVAVVCLQAFVKPQEKLLATARAEYAAQSRDLAEIADLPQVADDLPRAIRQMSERKKDLMARFAVSEDASRMYDLIGQLANRSGVHADRIDPVHGTSSHASQTTNAKSKFKVTLENYGYSIEAVGTYDKLADFTEALNTQTGVSRIASLVLEPLDVVEGQESRLRAVITTIHYRLPIAKPDPAAAGQGEQGGVK